MEKGLDRLREAAEVAQGMCNASDNVWLEATPAGVRAKITWRTPAGPFYTLENLTPWAAIHPRPDTKNPLISALDMLVKGRTEAQV